MSGGEFRYRFTGVNTTPSTSFDDSWIRFSDRDFRDDPEAKRRNTSVGAAEQTWAQDFWRIAQAVYLADRRSRRDAAPDRWTRTIELSVQVHEPDVWKSQCERLDSLLQLLTGDRWDIGFHDGIESPTKTPNLVDNPPTSVALFSGGLDSTAYAAYRAARLGHEERIQFVAFDPTVKGRQKEIFDEIKRLVPNQKSADSRMTLFSRRLLPIGGCLDSSNRSRSLTYIAAAVCQAAGDDISDVVVPENGQLAINPPLTSGRRSSCSTRSVHPWVIDTINQLIAAVGGYITVRNPFLHATKGEVCRCAIDSGLASEVLRRTVSCGRPTVARRDSNRAHFNCGTCFPCLVRRSGLHSALADGDDSGYAHPLASIDLAGTSRKARRDASHLRDLIQWLDTPFVVDDLLADTPYPQAISALSVMPVLERGRDELRSMLADLVPHLNPNDR